MVPNPSIYKTPAKNENKILNSNFLKIVNKENEVRDMQIKLKKILLKNKPLSN
jgi:hypothetical protein